MPRILTRVALSQVPISAPRPVIEEAAVAAPRDSVESRDSERSVGSGPHRFGALASTNRARHVSRRKTAHPPSPTITRLLGSREQDFLFFRPADIRATRQRGRIIPPPRVLTQHRSDLPPAVNPAQLDLCPG